MNRAALAFVGVVALGLAACASSGETGILPADEQFQTASRLYENGQYDRAVGAFQAFVLNYPQDPRVPDARWLASPVRPARSRISTTKSRSRQT